MPININKRFSPNSTLFFLVLGLLFFTATHSAGAGKGKKQKKKGVEYAMTVAAIRPAANDEAFITVTFSESQRFYRLPKDGNPVFLRLLRESEKTQAPVIVRRSDERSDIILSVRKK